MCRTRSRGVNLNAESVNARVVNGSNARKECCLPNG
jgi:hypothetical protein